MKPMREQFEAARKANDTAKLEQLKSQAAPQMEQMRALREKQMTEVRAVLTPEQQKKLDDKLAQFKAHGGKRGEGRKGAGREG
jgi:Spy/CpxP family protein refolding chaperone